MKEVASHTPGQWWASTTNNVYAKRLMPATGMQREHVADILIANEGASALSEEERCANAKLIASAPELLAALEAAHARLVNLADAFHYETDMQLVAQAEAAIQKAKP